MSNPTRACARCGEHKSPSAFHRQTGGRDGLHSQCRSCRKEYNRNHYSSHGRDKHLRDTYGITAQQYAEMLAKQRGVCAICGGNETVAGRPLVVDHCHSSGAIRGLLCDPCNKSLGGFRDNTSVLASAILYLENARCAS